MTYFYPGDRVRFAFGVEGPPPTGTLVALEEGHLGQTRALVAWDDGGETWWNLSQLHHEDAPTQLRMRPPR